MQSTDTSQTLRELLHILFRRKRTVILLTGSSVFVATLYSYAFLPKYEASSTILVKVGRESSNPRTDVLKPSPIVTTLNPSEIINSEVELLESRYVAEEIVRFLGEGVLEAPPLETESSWQTLKSYGRRALRWILESVDSILIWLDLKEALTAREKLILMLDKNLSAKVVQNSNTMRVTFRSSNPQLAAEIVNTAVSIYVRHHMTIHQSANALDFFNEQTRAFKSRLDEAEEKLRDFKDRFGVSSLEEQRSHLLQLNAEIRSDLRAVDVELARLTELVGGIKELAADNRFEFQDTDITKPSHVIDELKLKLTDLHARRNALKLKYSDGSPFVESIEQEIQEVESELRKEEAKEAVIVDIGALKSKKEELERLSGRSHAELAKLNQLEHELRALTRSVEENEGLYNSYFERTEEARTLQAMDTANITNVSIIEPAYVPILSVRTVPFIPQRIFTVALAFAVGLFVSLPVVAIREMFDDSLRSGKEGEEDLSIPVLGTISTEPAPSKTRKE